MINFILWDVDPEVISFGGFTLRWSALFMVAAFLAGRGLLLYIYKNESKPSTEVALMTGWFLVGALVIGRLAYVVFYEPQLFGTKPIEVLFPFSFKPTFHFTGSAGFSIHGAIVGIFLSACLYRRRKPFLPLLDRAAIISSLIAFFLFTGSFFESDVTGKATSSGFGMVNVQPVTTGLEKIPCCIMRNPDGENPLELVVAKKNQAVSRTDTVYKSIILYLFFKPGATEQLVNEFLIGDVKTFLFDMSTYVYEPGTEPLHYNIIVGKDGKYIGRVETRGVNRFPVQGFEAILSLAVFAFLFLLWKKTKSSVAPGKHFGYFTIFFWTTHLVLGFMREKQSALEIGFDILFVLIGVVTLITAIRKQPAKTSVNFSKATK